MDMTDAQNHLHAHKLKKKIFKDTMSYLPWAEWERFYETSKTSTKVSIIKAGTKKGSPVDSDDPNEFDPGFSFN